MGKKSILMGNPTIARAVKGLDTKVKAQSNTPAGERALWEAGGCNDSGCSRAAGVTKGDLIGDFLTGSKSRQNKKLKAYNRKSKGTTYPRRKENMSKQAK